MVNEERPELFSPYRVLDLTDEKGFLCGKIFADLGMDVIKIEKPGGDVGRRIGPFYHDIPDPEKSLFWFAYNTSKRSITLNIENLDGREMFKRLVKTAHFVIESFPPGYMDSLGLGYQALAEINPSLIMTSITPFGETGPYSDYKGADIVAMAMGGLMQLCGYPDRAPLRWSLEQTWPQAGVQAATVTIIAHYYRLTSGEGQHVDVSIRDCVIWGAYPSPQSWDMLKSIVGRTGATAPRGHLNVRLNHRCKDGYVAWMPWRGKVTRKLAEYMEEEGMGGSFLETDWDQVNMEAVSQEQLDRWQDDFEKFCLNHTKAELHEEAIKRGLMLWPMKDIKDLREMSQLLARDFWVAVEHPELDDTITYPGAPVKTSEGYWHIRRCAPLIGEHNEEVYKRELGFSESQLIVLKQAGAI